MLAVRRHKTRRTIAQALVAAVTRSDHRLPTQSGAAQRP